jgi:hypothetical protein
LPTASEYDAFYRGFALAMLDWQRIGEAGVITVL